MKKTSAKPSNGHKSQTLQPKGKKKEVQSYSIHTFDRKFADNVQKACGLNTEHITSLFNNNDVLYYQDLKKKGFFLSLLKTEKKTCTGNVRVQSS